MTAATEFCNKAENSLAKRISIISLLFLSFIARAEDYQPLPVDQAFSLTVKTTKTDSLIAEWQIAPGYYLYRERLHFKIIKPEKALLGHITFPSGIVKQDENLDHYQVYAHHLTIPVPLLNPTQNNTTLAIEYQGCAEDGFCYPPTLRLFNIMPKGNIERLPLSTEVILPNHPEKSSFLGKQESISPKSNSSSPGLPTQSMSAQTKIENILFQKNSAFALLLFLGFGLLLAFTPCVLPMIPILSGIIAGQNQINTAKAFRLTLTYIFAMAFAYALAGSLIAYLGGSLQVIMQHPFVIILFSVLFILLALSLFGFFSLELPDQWQQRFIKLSQRQQGGHYAGVASMGFLSSIIVSPCITPPLVGTLTYIGKTGDILFGATALFALGLGMGLPLLVIGTSFGKFIPQSGAWMETIKHFFGVLMIGLAIWLLGRILPGPLILLSWGCLTVICSLFLGAFKPVISSQWGKFWQGIGIVLLVFGILQIDGAAQGNSNPLQPLVSNHANNDSQTNTQATYHLFIPVKTINDLEQALAEAKTHNKPVMLDFYADWCVACKEMDNHVFSNPKVQQALTSFMLLRADVTANNKENKALMQKFGVIAPPTLVFFDKNGLEHRDFQIVGETTADEFIKHLKSSFFFGEEITYVDSK